MGPSAVGAARMRSSRYPILFTLLLATTLVVMAGAILAPILEVMRGALGLSGTEAGLVITTHALAIAVASPYVGWLIDRWGVRAPLAGGLLLYGVAGGAGLFITSFPLLLLDRLVFGIGAAAVFSGTTVAMLTLYRGEEQNRAMGLRSTASAIGGVAWPLLGGAVGGVSWHAPFAIYLIGIPLGIATLMYMKPTAQETDERSVDGVGKMDSILALLRRNPGFLVFYLIQVVGSVLLYALIVFLPQRLAQVGIDAPFLVSIYTVTISAVMGVVGLFYARLRLRLGYDALLRISVVSWMAGFLILATVSNPFLLALAPAVLGLGQGIVFPVTTVLIGEVAPPQLRGQAVSFSATATFAGQFASPLLLGPLIGVTSITTGFLISAGIAAVMLVVLLVRRVPTPDDADRHGPAVAGARPGPGPRRGPAG